MRLANRRDSTHAEVTQAFRALGWKVADLSRVGGGFPDILIARQCCKMALIEIKAAQTIAAPLFKGLRSVSAVLGDRVKSQYLVYGGSTSQERTGVQVLPCHMAGEVLV